MSAPSDQSLPDQSLPDFATRRAEARSALDALDPAMQADTPDFDPLRREWFETVYARAGGDPACVPWANLAPHPLTKDWVDTQARGIVGMSVLDVGCGLGDNAEYLAAAGADVVAFDLVAGAVDWAKRRFPETKVDYLAGDLFSLPAAWMGRFDLVHECYTLQALTPALLPRALDALAALLAPAGRLLIVARAAGESDDVSGPPWPLRPSFFEAAQDKLKILALEDITATAKVGRRHWRALLAPAHP